MEHQSYRNMKRSHESEESEPRCKRAGSNVQSHTFLETSDEHKNKRIKQGHHLVPTIAKKQNVTSSSTSKTLANNRLKKLRDELESTKNVAYVLPMKKNNSFGFDTTNSNIIRKPTSKKTNQEKSTTMQKRLSNSLQVTSPNKIEIDTKTSIKPNCDNYTSIITKTQDTKNSKSSLNDTFEDNMEMEWLPIDSEELLSDIRLVRDNLFSGTGLNAELLTNFNINQENTTKNVSENVYIIVDTNVFIDNIQTVVKILNITYEDGSHPVIFVPWMVIEELDYFKINTTLRHSKAIQTSSRKAIRFINDCLIAKKPNFQGQTVRDAAEDRSKISSPDDSILSCCLQAAKYNKAVLLSSDINLRNKAIINNIDAYTPSDILNVLMQKTMKQKINLIEKISNILSFVCSFIIQSELKEVMGYAWYTNKHFKELPWRFHDCMLYLKQYYDLVFKQLLPKQSLRIIEDLYEILRNPKDSTCDENKFIELCFSLLIYMKAGLPKYICNIEDTIHKIKLVEKECI